MTKEKRTFLVWTVTISGFAWMLAVGWLLFAAMPAEVENHSSSAVKDRMATQCQGSFRDRYECKEAIIVESGRDTFFTLAGRFLAVVVPPLLLSGWLSSYLRRNPVRPISQNYDLGEDWKSRAKKHTQIHPVQPAPHSDNPDILPEEPEPPTRPFSLDEIAPVDDWKARAQKKLKRPPQ